MIATMTTYVVALTVSLGRPITDEEARDVAARWAAALGAELGMTSTARDEPWMRVSASVTEIADDAGRDLGESATRTLVDELRRIGREVTLWHAVEVLTDDEQTRRAAHRGIPPLKDAAQFADLLDVKRQRIYQLLSERRDGKRADFPLPVIDGYWLATEADYYARTRRTQPGPPARTTS